MFCASIENLASYHRKTDFKIIDYKIGYKENIVYILVLGDISVNIVIMINLLNQFSYM